MNALSPLGGAREPSPLSPQQATRLDVLCQRLDERGYGRYEVRRDLAPTRADRQAFEARLAILVDAERPAAFVEVQQIVSLLLVSQNLRPNDTEGLMLLAAYQKALAGLPVWAVEHAVQSILTAQAGIDTAYAPKPQQVAEIARSRVHALRHEADRIRRVLEAEVYDPATPEQRAKAQSMIADVVARAQAFTAADELALAEEDERRRAAEHAQRRRVQADLEGRQRRKLAREADRLTAMEREYGPRDESPKERAARARLDAMNQEYGPPDPPIHDGGRVPGSTVDRPFKLEVL